MKLPTPMINFEDERGIIKDILSHETIDAVTIITSKKGSVRGNHYHKDTVQYNYILEGKIELLTQKPEQPVESAILNTGDLAMTVTYEKHALHALEDSVILILTRGPRNGIDYEKDTFRLNEPLVKSSHLSK